MYWARNLSYRILHPLWVSDAKRKASLLKPLLQKDSHILEVGCGPGTVLRELLNQGYRAVSLDVEDQRIVSGLPKPILYNGEEMPFEKQKFDVVLLFCVLHHCPDPLAVFREAARVGKRVAIVEDVFLNPIQLKVTQWTDSLVNGEFTGHPHQQKSEQEWRDLFEAEGWEVQHFDTWRLFGIYRQAFFWLEPK